MKLSSIYHPVVDLEAAVAFYRDVLGWDESWRMGTTTAGFTMPGTDIELLLDATTDEAGSPSGFFAVDDIDGFYDSHRADIDFVATPTTDPPVRWASFRDPSGNLVRLFQLLDDA